MCEFFANWDWSDFIQSAASVFVAYVAYRALETWKQQSKAKKQTDFLDELTDTVHEYIQLLAQPIEILKIVRIGIQSHASLPGNKIDIKHPDVIAYIENRGEENSKKLWSYLKECNNSV